MNKNNGRDESRRYGKNQWKAEFHEARATNTITSFIRVCFGFRYADFGFVF